MSGGWAVLIALVLAMVQAVGVPAARVTRHELTPATAAAFDALLADAPAASHA